MRMLVTGATGFVGRKLVARLSRPRVLSRDAERAKKALGDVEAFSWDPLEGPPPPAALDGVEAVIHLAGEPVAEGRWNAAKKARIRDSRVTGTRNLVAGLRAMTGAKPRVLVSASAIGIYGDRGDEVLDESSSPGNDFLAQVCREWEAEALAARDLGVRVACLRIGIVLGDDGGALGKMLLPFKLCLGGKLGSGRQWMSWVHVQDVVGLALHAAATESASGPLDTTAPNPVTNADFTRALASALGRPAFLPAPAFGLRLMFGEMASVLLGSQRVLPRAAEKTGYRFAHPELAGALRAALQGSEEAPARAGAS
jgi:uncharacterized protein (TIGR01777 family)